MKQVLLNLNSQSQQLVKPMTAAAASPVKKSSHPGSTTAAAKPSSVTFEQAERDDNISHRQPQPTQFVR